MTYLKDFHVAIVGGGMCGLACAVYLSRAGIKVDLFESAVRYMADTWISTYFPLAKVW